MTNIAINEKKHTIELTKKDYDKACRFGTQEYYDLQEVRKAYPNFEIPAEYNLLIINASSETSLKIKSHVDYVIVHSMDNETQVQVRGRVNSDLSCLYLPSNDPSALTVPEDFLNRPLFTQDKAELCDILNQSNASGRRYGWPTVHRMLIECDYCVSEGRRDNRRFALITQTQE